MHPPFAERGPSAGGRVAYRRRRPPGTAATCPVSLPGSRERPTRNSMSMNPEAQIATRRSSGGSRYAPANAEPLVAYFADIAHIPTLSREEQVSAAKAFEDSN